MAPRLQDRGIACILKPRATTELAGDVSQRPVLLNFCGNGESYCKLQLASPCLDTAVRRAQASVYDQDRPLRFNICLASN
jgi:hypothetical protein